MSNQPEISSEVFQALYLNEDIYWVEIEKPNENLSSNTKSIGEPELVEGIAKEIVEKKSDSARLQTQTPQPEKIESQSESVDNEVAEKKVIPLLFIVDSITEADKVFLEKVLNAVKLQLIDVDFFTTDLLKTTDFRTYSSGKSYQRIISFGVPFSKIGMTRMFMPYEIAIIKNIQFLMCEQLVVVENDLSHKRQFWGCLQKMF
ncbi:MAG: hypothetical protein V4683_15375 [Bacteroidota bacterium]